MGKKKRREQAEETRRRRELERLQATVEEQQASAPSSPGKLSPSSPPGKLPLSPPSGELPSSILPGQLPPFLPLRDKPVASEADRLWHQFEGADLEGKVSLFSSMLEAGELDDEYAFEMLGGIRAQLDLRDPQARARYAGLVDRLRQQAPDLYEQSASYYNEVLIYDAVTDGRWEALPELLAPFAENPNLDMFAIVVDRLMYHGQTRSLIQTMARAWPQVSKSADLLPWAIEEFAGQLMNLHLFDYLKTAPAPRADDPALLEATAPYGEWREGWLEQFIPRLSAPAPSAWQPADFGEAVDADQWHDNLHHLLAEFVADRRRAGVPDSRGYMAWAQLAEVLERQFAATSMPRSEREGKRGKGKTRGLARSAVSSSPLVPRYQAMDEGLVDLFHFLGAQPYRAAAVVELLPAYLHFLARLGLLHPTEMDAAIQELQPLKKQGAQVIEHYGGDLRAVDTVVAAWSEEALSALRDDPALAAARATPPAPPTPPLEKPAPRPGALQTYTFKVTYLQDPDVWRTIEIAGHQTLDDLHGAIQDAVDFDRDHLYSFYMSNRAWDESTEYAHPSAKGPSAARVKIGDLNLRTRQRFLYLFDYGDEHRFEVQLVGVNPDAPKGKYPRVVERNGENPPQYGEWDEDEEEWDEGDEEWDEDEEEWDEDEEET